MNCDLGHSAQLWLEDWAELGKTKDIDPGKINLTTTSSKASCQLRNKLSWVGGWASGCRAYVLAGIGNKAQLSPARAGAGAWPELSNDSL